MFKQAEKILFESLIEKKILSREEAQKILSASHAGGNTFYNHLVQNGHVTEDQVLRLLSEKFSCSTVKLSNLSIDPKVINRIPIKIAWYYKFMPLKIDERTLTIAVALPPDVRTQDEIRVNLGLQPRVVLSMESEIIEALKKYYGLAADTIDRILTKEPGAKTAITHGDRAAVEDLEAKSEEASVIKLVNQIILEAYKKRATDIHIEPYRDRVRFRYRIDGALVDANLPPEIKHFLLPILSRIKIMANLSIVEKRLPQDGSAVVKTKDQTLDLRVSTIPTPRGESMVIRILPSKVMLFSLEKLGLHAESVKTLRELIKKPHGIIFATGPTGSGKSTTLYACLNEVNSIERKIITIEDPVEYEMENITQIQVNPKVDLDFARGLRSILRHDPDIIMVGEVRDFETAEIAIRTSLTGHLVFSTLHTNDAASGITRLIDMGLEPYLVASSVEAFIAQRLVRIICPHCKKETTSGFLEVKEEIAAAIKKDVKDIKIYYGPGCERCNKTGFLGRTAIHEILLVDEEIRAAILEKPRADYIKHIAMKKGMTTLRQDGWRKVAEGLTHPMEVLNVTSKEDYDFSDEKSEKVVTKDVSAKPKAPDALLAPEEIRTISKKMIDDIKKDKRTYPRVPEKVKIHYRIFEPEKDDNETLTIKTNNVEHTSVTKDISAGGLKFSCGQSVPVGSILELKIFLGAGEANIECLARVCRAEEDDISNMFNIGLYYLDISSADRARIKDFVNRRIVK